MSDKKKLLIVSSYDRPCGIAQYVEYLIPELKKHSMWEVDIAPLPVDIFRMRSSQAKKCANKALQSIIGQVRQADVVSIQFESGLFGRSPFKIWSRIRKIIRASKKVVITYHTVLQIEMKIGFSLLGWIKHHSSNFVLRNLLKESCKNPEKFFHIVHTKRDRRKMVLFGIDEKNIVDFPLAFLSQSQKRHCVAVNARATIEAGRRLTGKKIIGCFGFLSRYKGFDTAIKALRCLPGDYHLVIVGGLHPQGIAKYVIDQPYINFLNRVIKEENLFERVHFLGALDNESFMLAMQACDVIVLPYAEVGQTSSGPAALSLDLKKPTFCSNNNCFRQLASYAKNAIQFFEISNYIELAEKIRITGENHVNFEVSRLSYGHQFNIEKRARLYIECCEKICK